MTPSSWLDLLIADFMRQRTVNMVGTFSSVFEAIDGKVIKYSVEFFGTFTFELKSGLLKNIPSGYESL